MEIVISDTNIFIDLWNIGLLERFCELPLSIHTTDFIIRELKTQGVKEAVIQLQQKHKITVKTFKSNEYSEIMSLQDKNLSFQDCTVLYYALSSDYKLLTGDRNLRKVAERHGLQVSGIIYVIDELLHHEILSEDEYIAKLKALLDSNHRLPIKEIMKRLEE